MTTFTGRDWLPAVPDNLQAVMERHWRDVHSDEAPPPMLRNQEAMPVGSGGQPVTAVPALPDLDLGWLGELRLEHHRLLDAWHSSTGGDERRTRAALAGFARSVVLDELPVRLEVLWAVAGLTHGRYDPAAMAVGRAFMRLARLGSPAGACHDAELLLDQVGEWAADGAVAA